MIDTKATPFQSSSSALLGKVAGSIAFRVRSGEQPGRLVHLRALKCTIGSAPDCTLRIRASGVHAVHCLVMRGVGGVTVKAWAQHTFLNGRPFQDARLNPGDRLQIGPVELEFVDETKPVTHYNQQNVPTNSDQLVREITARVKADLARRQQRAWRKTALKKIHIANTKISQLKKRLRKTKQQVAEQVQECTRLQHAIQFAEQRATNANFSSSVPTQPVLTSIETHTTEVNTAARLSFEQAQREWSEQQQHWTSLQAELEHALAAKQAELEQRIQELQAARDLQAATLRRCEEQEAAQLAAEASRLSLWEQLQAEESRRTVLENLLSDKESALGRQIAAFQGAQAQLANVTELAAERQQAFEFAEHARQTYEAQIRDGERVRLDLERRLAEKATELTQAQESLAAAQTSHDAVFRESEELKRELVGTRIIATNLENQLADLSHFPPTLEQTPQLAASVHDQALAAHQEQVAELARCISSKEEDLATLQQYLLSLQQSLNVAHESSVREQERASELAAQLAETLLQRDTATQELSQLQAQLEATQNECSTQAIELTQLQQDLAALQQAHQQQAAEFATHQAQYEKLRACADLQLTELTNTQQQLQATISDLQSELIEQASLLAQARQALQDSQTQLAQQAAQHVEQQTNAQTRIDTLEILVDRLEDELRSATKNNLAESPEWEQLRNTTEVEREQWMAQFQALQQQLQADQAEQEELQRELSELRSELTFSQQRVQERDRMLEQIRVEVKQQFEEWSAERNEFVNQLEAIRTVSPVAMPTEPPATCSEPCHEPTLDHITEQNTADESPRFWRNLGANDANQAAPADVSEPLESPSPEIEEESLHGHAVSETFSAVMARLNAVGMIKMPHVAPHEASLSPLPTTSLLEPDFSETEEASVETELAHVDTILAPMLKSVDVPVPPSAAKESLSSQSSSSQSSSSQSNSFEAMKAKLLAEAADEVESSSLAAQPLKTPTIAELKAPVQDSVPSVVAGEQEHDSIEDYMSKLLKRVRGESVAMAAHPAPQSVVPVEAPATVMENPQTEQQVIAPLADDEEYAPRSPAPEKNVDIGALRDIAVSSARQAIDLSTVRSRRQQALWIMVGVFCGTVAGSVLLVYAIKTGTLWAAYTAFPCFGLGLYGMIQRVKLLQKSWA